MGRHLLMQSLLGHLSLLAEQHPKKANSVVAKRAKVAAVRSLRMPTAGRQAAPARKGCLSCRPEIRRARFGTESDGTLDIVRIPSAGSARVR